MNLYEPLPDYVIVKGKKYKMHTDFRKWLELYSTVKAGSEIRFSDYYVNAYPDNANDCVYGVVRFLLMKEESIYNKEEKGASKTKKNVISFEIDAPFIASAFLQCYRIDLLDMKTKLHWWKFRILLDGLPADTEIKKRMMYRGMDASSIKNKKERERIRKIQSKIALPQEVLSDYEIGNAF